MGSGETVQQVRYFCFTNLKKPETAMNFHISGYTIKITNMNTTIYGTICLPNLQVSCVFFGGVGCIHWQNTPTPCLRGRFFLRFWPTRCVGFVRRLRGGYAVLFGADLFSPTAIALGPSAIVKVSLLSDSLWFSGADPSWAGP